jgi:hypothetical protein
METIMTTQPLIFEAIRADDADRVRRLLAENASLAAARDERNVSAVLLARYGGRTGALAALLESGPMLDIFEASAVGSTERVRALLDSDATQANAFAPDGFFPLGLAAFFGHPEIVRLLLERGADVHAVARNPMRVQALHAAVADKQEPLALEIAGVLLGAGADANARQQGGFTPLHAAAQNGHARLADLLLACGADADAATEDGRTAAQLAEEHGHAGVAARLRGVTPSPGPSPTAWERGA